MRASLRLLVLSACCVLGLLTAVGATTVTIDAEKNDCPIDMGQKAVPVKLTPGEWEFRVDGELFYGDTAAVHDSPCGEVLINTDPTAVRALHGETPVAMLRASLVDSAVVHVRRATTAYLFLADRSVTGNSGSVEVTVTGRGQPRKYRVDAVRNCYELDLDHHAVPLAMRPGCYWVVLRRSTLEYADHASPLEDQPDQVLIDCNQAVVGTIGEGGESLGTVVLSRLGEAVLIGIDKPTTLRFYLSHSKARSYRGKLVVSLAPYTMEDVGG